MARMRASGRVKAVGGSKELRRLQVRQSDYDRIDAVTRATMKRPGTMQKHR